MIKILYRNRTWDLICPKELKFENNTIRNIMIKKGEERVITNIKEIKILGKIKSLDQF